MDEGNTLSDTLLPFLNKVYDYSFLQEKDHFIASRFLNSLVRHIIDTRVRVGMGFMLFGLKLDPSKLVDIVGFERNYEALFKALIYLKYSKASAEVMALHPGKFLWLDLPKFFEGKTE